MKVVWLSRKACSIHGWQYKDLQTKQEIPRTTYGWANVKGCLSLPDSQSQSWGAVKKQFSSWDAVETFKC